MPRGHVAVRNGVEARKPRLAREQVVAALAQPALLGVEAYAEEAALFVVERGEIHAVAQFNRPRGQVAAAVFAKPRGEGRKARGEVAAVHGGDIARRKRPERPEVVPVIELAAPLLKALAGLEHALGELRRPLRPREGQIRRGEAAYEGEADIRRRGPLRRADRRLLLDVVRREIPARGRAVFVKIRPHFRAFAKQELPATRAEGALARPL